MIIKYKDGSSRVTDGDHERIISLLKEDLGCEVFVSEGLVWDINEDSENDDGKLALAEITNYEGYRDLSFEY